MKKITLLFVAFLLIFVGCQKENTNSTTSDVKDYSDYIVGDSIEEIPSTWTKESETLFSYQDEDCSYSYFVSEEELLSKEKLCVYNTDLNNYVESLWSPTQKLLEALGLKANGSKWFNDEEYTFYFLSNQPAQVFHIPSGQFYEGPIVDEQSILSTLTEIQPSDLYQTSYMVDPPTEYDATASIEDFQEYSINSLFSNFMQDFSIPYNPEYYYTINVHLTAGGYCSFSNSYSHKFKDDLISYNCLLPVHLDDINDNLIDVTNFSSMSGTEFFELPYTKVRTGQTQGYLNTDKSGYPTSFQSRPEESYQIVDNEKIIILGIKTENNTILPDSRHGHNKVTTIRTQYYSSDYVTKISDSQFETLFSKNFDISYDELIQDYSDQLILIEMNDVGDQILRQYALFYEDFMIIYQTSNGEILFRTLTSVVKTHIELQ